jgi:hypothetical protein
MDSDKEEIEKFYCDVEGHENIVLTGNDEDGWDCAECTEEETTQHKCVVCDEFKSCGNFDEDKDFHCEECANDTVQCEYCDEVGLAYGHVEFRDEIGKVLCEECNRTCG